ncbi:MAG TPA: TetR/AcrR family transcriptional regulator [Chthoniobacterales bacterium]|jgi:AcrR family transcriptional regulator|nr:TetR/AcrR family transcriptional regulator [Chthoniobacterales bacterium]
MQQSCEHLDPRVRRTRRLLVDAFNELLAKKDFEVISVQDIAEQATVNRATFYDHFPDKFALLDYLIEDDFRNALKARMGDAAPSEPEGLRRIMLALCNYLDELGKRCPKHRRQFEPMVESKIKAVVRDILLSSLKCPNDPGQYSAPELVATMASWAMYGAALEWSRTKVQPAKDFIGTVLPLITATLQLPVMAKSR